MSDGEAATSRVSEKKLRDDEMPALLASNDASVEKKGGMSPLVTRLIKIMRCSSFLDACDQRLVELDLEPMLTTAEGCLGFWGDDTTAIAQWLQCDPVVLAEWAGPMLLDGGELNKRVKGIALMMLMLCAQRDSYEHFLA